MGFARINTLGNGWLFAVLAGGKKMFYFPEYPWITNGSTAYHHAIGTVFQPPISRFFGRIDVTITKNRDLHTRVFLDVAYERPVGFALVHLCTGTAMYG